MADMAQLYDFSLIEQAVQTYFTALPGSVYVAPPSDDDPNREIWQPEAGEIAFYTAFQNETFQKCRPRVYLHLNNINAIANAQIVDSSNVLRDKAWRGTVTFGIVTKPSYIEHIALRTQVMSVIPQLPPLVVQDGSAVSNSGLNAILQLHEVGVFEMGAQTTHIAPEDGNYNSIIPCNVTFNVRATAWPGGMITDTPPLPPGIGIQGNPPQLVPSNTPPRFVPGIGWEWHNPTDNFWYAITISGSPPQFNFSQPYPT